MKRTALTKIRWTGSGAMWRTNTGCRAIVATEPDGLHISVSARDRYPTWDELAAARDRFGTPKQRFVMHFPPHDEYVNAHETCLHLWETR